MTKVFVNAEATQRKVNKKHVVEMIIAKFIFVCRRKIDLPRSIQFFCRFFSIEILQFNSSHAQNHPLFLMFSM